MVLHCIYTSNSRLRRIQGLVTQIKADWEHIEQLQMKKAIQGLEKAEQESLEQAIAYLRIGIESVSQMNGVDIESLIDGKILNRIIPTIAPSEKPEIIPSG